MGHEQDFWDESHGCIRVRKVTLRTATNGTVLYDPNFLSSGYSRKIYSSSEPDSFAQTQAHKHETPQMSHVLYGDQVRMAYQDQDGRIQIVNLRPGEYYYIEANVPHQFESRGPAALESFSPSSLCIKWLVSGRQLYNVQRVPNLFKRAVLNDIPIH